ncbi:MAG: pyridoxal phosphate-dependent aminotransferase [Deltaproteobacteria bacterium]|nr:pyridoxal phosphate-dependent aminotransferase [Deltaproteobacteria bacterium]
MKFAKRMSSVKPSATLAMTNRAKTLQAAGKDVISFGAGEPDFDTPAHVTDAMVEAARRGETRYAPVNGIPKLRAAVAKQFSELYGVDFDLSEILVSTGGKHSLYNLFQVLVDPGDEVIIPAPYWVSYPDQVLLAEGVPVFVDTLPDEGFRLTAEAVEAAVTPRTIGLVLNSPNNPTGAVQSAADLRAIAEVAERHDLWIITDDIYSYIRYGDGPFDNVLRERPDLKDRIFVVHGASKTYGMTGWRLGFTGAPKRVIDQMAVIQGQATSGATTFAQFGALAAVGGDHAFLKDWLAAYDSRRKAIVDGLNAIPGMRCAMPGGAFYVFPDARAFIGKRFGDKVIESDMDLCEVLLDDALVACVPGTPFGAPGFFRMSYACSIEDIQKGLERMATTIAKLR